MTDAATTETSEPPRGTGQTSAAIDLADPQHRLSHSAASWLRDAVARAVVLLQSTGEARIRIVGDVEIAAAHQEYLGEPGTTDVITFDLSDPEEDLPYQSPSSAVGAGGPSAPGITVAGIPGRTLDTDILICFDEAARQSERRGHSVEQELLLYVVHGLLHCLGHDDHDATAAALMHEAEDRVLSALGVGATYSRATGSPPLRAATRARPDTFERDLC